jgi:hypothetical protein
MKYKAFASFLVIAIALTLLVGLAVRYQAAQASAPSLNVAIIGGVINARETSHITIATTPEAHVGMRIFYRCISPSELIRTVYANAGANTVGHYTWQWTQGAPCYTGSATVIVVSTFAGKQAVAQKVLKVVPLVAINGNPWWYNFTPGHLIYRPASAFCRYFSCVSTFWTSSNGYVAECVDGKYTHSGSVSGACSRNGGILRSLYSH